MHLLTTSMFIRGIVVALLVYICVVITQIQTKIYDLESYLDSIYLEVSIVSHDLDRKIEEASYSTKFLFDLLQNVYDVEESDESIKEEEQ